MKKHKHAGFTLIEISLFLAITGLVFVGIIMGTQGALVNQRFYDSTMNFYEFLQSVYSQASNPQSVGKGDSNDLAIYGKLIVFGEHVGLNGETVNNDGIQRVYVYDVVGGAENSGTGDVVGTLINLGATAIVPTDRNPYTGAVTRVGPAGIVEDYTPRWDSQIETTAKGSDRKAFTGSILIVRHPSSGTINTLVSNNVLEVNDIINKANYMFGAGANSTDYKTFLTNQLLSNSFGPRELDFCVNPEGAAKESDSRRNIRIVKNARNSSGVELIDLDGSENRCL